MKVEGKLGLIFYGMVQVEKGEVKGYKDQIIKQFILRFLVFFQGVSFWFCMFIVWYGVFYFEGVQEMFVN